MKYRTATQTARGLIGIMGDRAEAYAARRAEIYEEIDEEEVSTDWRLVRLAIREQMSRGSPVPSPVN